MDVEFEELGINVDSEEMFELFQGNNVHPEISKIQIFQNPNTKQFDRAYFIFCRTKRRKGSFLLDCRWPNENKNLY